MNNLIFLATSTDPASTGLMIVWIGAMALLFYFMIIRPQKIDIMEEVVIVEFGNNKNCRIPMKKSAIIEIEKPSSAETDK
ncbi:MAG: hypothetical protein K0S18_1278 [Anaerocolumna sp.]|nr:hypothetical protein [Anaerocolumna sp.]